MFEQDLEVMQHIFGAARVVVLDKPEDVKPKLDALAAFDKRGFHYSTKCGLCRAQVDHNLTQHNTLTGRL